MNKSYSSTYSDSNQSSEMPRLCYNKDSNEFIAFKVELKADKFKIKIPDEEEKPASINRPNQPILDTCILFKLSFPLIAYYQGKNFNLLKSIISEIFSVTFCLL